MREKAGMYNSDSEEEDEEMKSVRKTAAKIREKRKIMVMESKEKRRIEKPRIGRAAKRMDMTAMKSELGELGIEMEAATGEGTHAAEARSRSVTVRQNLKRKREESVARSESRVRSASRPARSVSGVRPETLPKMRKIA